MKDAQSAGRAGLRIWRGYALGMLLGVLSAGSASSQPERWSRPSSSSALSAPATTAPAHVSALAVGRARQVRLADGRQLRLSADGAQLSLWSGSSNRPLRVYRLSPSRAGATLSLLPSGRVLVWGGADGRGMVQADGLWFDPTQATLEAARGLPLQARAGHGATLLTDGRLLLSGGGASAEAWEEGAPASTPLADAQWPEPGRVESRLQADGSVRVWAAGVPEVRSRSRRFEPKTGQWGPWLSPAVEAAALAGSEPVAGGTVTPEGRLALRLARPLRVAELHRAQVSLVGPGGGAAVRLTAAEEGRLLFAQPRQPLFPGSAYTLLVAGAIDNASGRALPLLALDFHTASLAAEARVGAESADASASEGGCGGAGAPRLCAAHARLHEGHWTPGRDSTDGRWRVGGAPPSLPAEEILSRVTAAAGLRALSGQVLQVDARPVANVEVSIGERRTRTDAAGRFLLHAVPSGRQELYVDGSTANRSDAEYGQFVAGVEIAAVGLSQVPYTMYLPKIRARDKRRIDVPLREAATLTHPDLPGLRVEIPAGTVIRDRKGRLVRELALVPTPVDRAPFPVAGNYPMYFTVEPGGAVIQGLTPASAQGVRIHYPNYDRHPAGTSAQFWAYSAQEGWRVYGQGRVSADGRHFIPEAGVALHQWMGGSYTVDAKEIASEDDQPECKDGCGVTQGGGGAVAGDPIDLRTGKFYYQDTDLVVPDLVPIRIGRAYRSTDVGRRDFGIGTALSYEYKLSSADPERLELILPSGSGIVFTRESGSGLSGRWRQRGSVTDYNGAVLEWGSLGDGQSGYLLRLTDGSRMAFYRHAPNYLLWQEDRFGNRTQFSYEAGLLSRISSPSGRDVRLERDAQGRIQAIQTATGARWEYVYDGRGLLSEVRYPDQTRKQYHYRYRKLSTPACPSLPQYRSTCRYLEQMFAHGKPLLAHAVERVVDRRGHTVVRNEFHSVPGLPEYIGPVVKQTQADGAEYQFAYSGFTPGLPEISTRVTAPDGSRRLVEWSAQSRYPSRDTLGAGTAQAQPVSYERDAVGRVTVRTDALGRRSEYRYDGAGRVTELKRAANGQTRTVRASYTAQGDLASVTDPQQRTTRFSYRDGCLSQVTDADGRSVQIECNLAGQPVQVRDALGQTTRLEYDQHALVAVTDPLGRRVQIRYDGLGRPIALEDPQGGVRRLEYDVFGRVVKQISAGGQVTQTAYDGNDNVVAVLLPHGNGVTYDYDARNRLSQRTDALGQQERWSYDGQDRVQRYTDRQGRTTEYDYDVLGRLTTTRWPGAGGHQRAHYDAGNRLVRLEDSQSGALSWSYDGFDAILEASSEQGQVRYGYDAAGRRQTLSVPGQAEVRYGYDGSGRLHWIERGSERIEYGYDRLDRLRQLRLPNGVETAYVYDAASQLTGLAWASADGTVLGSLGYGYDANGRIVSQRGSAAPTRLPDASADNAFDDNGRQTRYRGAQLRYDADGNLLDDGERQYLWNARQQLEEIREGGQPVARYRYDGLGRRVERSEGRRTTRYLYDGWNVAQEVEEGVANPLLSGLGLDQHYGRTEQGRRVYALRDHLGSVRALTNAEGQVVVRYEYTPYGVTTSSVPGDRQPYRYTGREQDASGLYYYRARYYHPGMGRFLSEDPIGLAGGINPYAYVGGNPISFIDPLGLVGCYISWLGYPITIPGTNMSLPLVHAGVLSYDGHGNTRYYEYGRYGDDFGSVRNRVVPNLKVGGNGEPTADSWNNLMEHINKFGKGRKARVECDFSADYKKINDFAENRMNDPNRAPYSWNPFNMNTCTTFAKDAINSGR